MIYGNMPLEDKIHFSYNEKDISHFPFTLTIGNIDFSMNERQVDRLANEAHNVLKDYDYRNKNV